MRSAWAARLMFLVVVPVLAAPLFVGLGRWEMRNDEAIYSYAVERMLDTGDWLNPRAIPDDSHFVEKPPLKYWLVAGLMKIGVLPRNEAGMRGLDAVFGTIAFAYVFALGVRLGGPMTGAIGLFVLFAYFPLIFEHGLRSNNMEAALVLAYTGGLAHLLWWLDAPDRARRHAWAVAAYFVLGFMTKFVAALFLPVVAIAVVLWRSGGLALLGRVVRASLLPGLAATAAIAPWFVYQTLTLGIWEDIIGTQVYRRFTASLDPTHLQPWHYYLTDTWRQLQVSHTAWFVAAGLMLIGWRALRRADPVARLLLAWAVVPVVLISLGTSKLPHYVYPFLPPLALAGGLAASSVLTGAGQLAGRASAWLATGPPAPVRGWLASHRRLVLVGAVVLLGLSAWTYAFGPLELRPGGIRLFRNSSVLRPGVAGVVLLFLAGQVRTVFLGLGALFLLKTLPLGAYATHLEIATRVDRPKVAAAQCLVAEAEARGIAPPGVYATDPTRLSHPYFYYFRHAGPWTLEANDLDEQVRRRLLGGAADHTPVLFMRDTWVLARERFGLEPPGRSGLSGSPLDVGVEFPDDRVLLFSPAYAGCIEAVIAAGGHRLTASQVPGP